MSEEKSSDIKAVLFDLDETLIDAQKGLKAAHYEVSDKLCKYLDCDEPVEVISKKLSDFDDRMNRERKYDRDQWWRDFAEELEIGGDLKDSQIEDLTETYWSTYAEAAEPYRDAESILEYLHDKGYLLGILTDTDDTDVSKKERIYPLDFSDLFDSIIVCGEDTKNSKPDTKPYELATSQLDVDYNECAMVGDKPFSDIKGAQKVGMMTILVKRREWETDIEPDMTIKSLDKLKEIF